MINSYKAKLRPSCPDIGEKFGRNTALDVQPPRYCAHDSISARRFSNRSLRA